MAEQHAYHLALAIHDHLQQRRSAFRSIELPEATWLTCQSLQRQLRRALAHGWQLAARRLNRDFNVQIRSLVDQVSRLPDDRRTAVSDHQSTARDLYQDIVSLEDDFDDVSWNIRQ